MFDITFETISPESAENVDFEETGFLHEGLSFREAMDVLRWASGCHVEADCYPVRNPRWFTFYNAEENFATGSITNYALHIPEHITEASRRRIAKLVRCYGV